jgi:hypothetical protein
MPVVLARITGSASKLSELRTHVDGGTLPVDALHTDGSVNVDKCLTLAKASAHHSMEDPVG